jgi:hypothetical protein
MTVHSVLLFQKRGESKREERAREEERGHMITNKTTQCVVHIYKSIIPSGITIIAEVGIEYDTKMKRKKHSYKSDMIVV